MKKYFVYILRCSDNSYYTGFTNDIDRRLIEHQEGMDPRLLHVSKKAIISCFRH
jgi:putative endonuclease